MLEGSFGSVNLTSTGTGSVYIVGVTDTVTVDLTGGRGFAKFTYRWEGII